MSMLRTLQSNVGTVSLFTSKEGSGSLKRILETFSLNPALSANVSQKDASPDRQKSATLWGRVVHGKTNKPASPDQKYLLELIPYTQTPTFDQIKLVKSFALERSTAHSETSKQLCQQRLLACYKTAFPLFVTAQDSITSPIDEAEYRRLIEDKKGWFHPPLVVDWDKRCIATDAESLYLLLKAYE